MSWSAWLFSAKLAWSRPLIKVLLVSTILMQLGAIVWFLSTVLPHRDKTGTLIMHYNVYLGIDQIHPWPWIFLIPGIWLVLTWIDLIWALGSFREDKHVAWSLLIFGCVWGFPWIVALFYLARINV